LRSAANLQASHDLAYGNLNSDYNLTQYLANQKLDTALRGNANNFAGAGTLHSSIYDQANQQSALANQNTLAQAAQRRAEQQAGLDMTLRSGDVGLLNQLATGQSDAAGRAAQAAYQQQLDAANAKYQQDQLALQQQANKQQQDYYNQMSGVNSQAQAQQSQYIQSLIGKLQPQTFDNPLTAGGYDPMSAIAGGIQGGTAYDPLNALYSKLQHTSW